MSNVKQQKQISYVFQFDPIGRKFTLSLSITLTGIAFDTNKTSSKIYKLRFSVPNSSHARVRTHSRSLVPAIDSWSLSLCAPALLQHVGGLRVRTETPADFGLLADHDLADFPDRFQQQDGHVVVAALEQHLALERDQFVLAGAQQQPHQLVVDVGVDIEQLPEQDAPDLGRLLRDRVALVVDDGAQLQHLLVHLDVGLLAAVLGEAAGLWSAVLLFADLEPLHPTVRLREGIRQLGLGVALLTVVEHGDLRRQRGVHYQPQGSELVGYVRHGVDLF